MNVFKIFFIVSLITQIGCLENNNNNKQSPKNNTLPINPNGLINSVGCLLFNTSFSDYYHAGVPKAPYLGDDPANRQGGSSTFFIVAKLDQSLKTNLPSKIKEKLGNNEIDIFWVVQSTKGLGEPTDHAGKFQTTRLLPHAWIDPMALGNKAGTGIQRDVLMGVFETEQNISTPNFPAESMISNEVHTHDGIFSPRPPNGTNMLNISMESDSQSFWSLVIDGPNAVATLHWLIEVPGGEKKYEDEIKNIIKNTVSFKDLITKLNNSTIFESTEMLKKLNSLLK